jgi:threonine/homoserine/homoserine lactone efflux protein
MTLDVWLTYTLAAAVVLIIPGPTILLVISQALAHGKRAVFPLAAGVLFGDFTAMVLSLMGLGTVLAVSGALFGVLKWLGALYLVYLGVKMWRATPDVIEIPQKGAEEHYGRSLFARAYLVTATNPKGIAFFIAFLPQFVQPGAPVLPQLSVLGTTFLLLAGINAALYGLFAGGLRETLQRRSARRCFNRCGAVALVGAGVVTAALRRAS